MHRVSSSVLLTAGFLLACGGDPKSSEEPGGTPPAGDSADTGVDTGTSETGPTWYGGVGHVVSQNCGSCHRSGGLAENLSFEEPELAATLSAALAGAASSGEMPPFMAQESEECENPWGWQHDPRLSEEELDLLVEWDATGARIGTEDPANPIPDPPTADLAGAQPPIFPAGSWTTEPIGEVQDEFICFSLDPDLSEQAWLDGVQVVPDNALVVHHVLVGLDRTGASAALADEDGVYPCFGGFGDLGDVAFISAWVPGSAPVTFPEHSALKVPAESRFVVQMHYHRAATAETDRSGLALRFTEQAPVRQASMGLVGNGSGRDGDVSILQPGPDDPASGPAFFIPAGSSDHTETMYAPMFDYLTRPQEVFLIGNHMHYIGTNMRTWIARGDSAPTAEEACLLHTPAWDFNWQQFFQFDASDGPGPLIYPGDQLWMQCAFDNTLDNPAVVKALAESGLSEPIDVTLGEGSLNEMCISILGTVPQVDLHVDNETHAGEVAVTISSATYGIEQTCRGPASARVEADGSTTAIAACGLDALGYLYTVEFSASGTVSDDGSFSGTVSVSALEVPGSADGTVSGPTDASTIEAVGEWAGGDIRVSGQLTF